MFFGLARCGYTLRVTSQAYHIHLSTLHQHRKKIMITRLHRCRRN
jgi:hypothetical protein